MRHTAPDEVADIDLHAASDARGDYIEVSFFAPSGCYATVVMRELMKTEEAT